MNIKTLAFGALATATLTSIGTMAEAKTRIIVNCFWPPQHYTCQEILPGWLAKVEEITEGRVVGNIPPKSVAPPPEQLASVEKGIVDAAIQFNGLIGNRVNGALTAMQPFSGTMDGVAMTQAAWETREKFYPDEFDTVELLAQWVITPGRLFSNTDDADRDRRRLQVAQDVGPARPARQHGQGNRRGRRRHAGGQVERGDRQRRGRQPHGARRRCGQVVPGAALHQVDDRLLAAGLHHHVLLHHQQGQMGRDLARRPGGDPGDVAGPDRHGRRRALGHHRRRGLRDLRRHRRCGRRRRPGARGARWSRPQVRSPRPGRTRPQKPASTPTPRSTTTRQRVQELSQ